MSVIASAPFTLSEAPTRDELLAKYFRGLGDPTRLRILHLLSHRGELAAGEIVAALALPQATISTHLRCLRWCGFVATRRAHRSVIYRLADDRVAQIIVLGQDLLGEHAECVACCEAIDPLDGRNPD